MPLSPIRNEDLLSAEEVQPRDMAEALEFLTQLLDGEGVEIVNRDDVDSYVEQAEAQDEQTSLLQDLHERAAEGKISTKAAVDLNDIEVFQVPDDYDLDDEEGNKQEPGWYWWQISVPGSLPVPWSERGPFETEDEAWADASKAKEEPEAPSGQVKRESSSKKTAKVMGNPFISEKTDVNPFLKEKGQEVKGNPFVDPYNKEITPVVRMAGKDAIVFLSSKKQASPKEVFDHLVQSKKHAQRVADYVVRLAFQVRKKAQEKFSIGDKVELVKEIEAAFPTREIIPVGTRGEITRTSASGWTEKFGAQYVVLTDTGYRIIVVGEEITKISSRKTAATVTMPYAEIEDQFLDDLRGGDLNKRLFDLETGRTNTHDVLIEWLEDRGVKLERKEFDKLKMVFDEKYLELLETELTPVEEVPVPAPSEEAVPVEASQFATTGFGSFMGDPRKKATKKAAEPFGGGEGLGPGGTCVCPKCDYVEEHATAEPCWKKTCPECGVKMTRKAGQPEIGDKLKLSFEELEKLGYVKKGAVQERTRSKVGEVVVINIGEEADVEVIEDQLIGEEGGIVEPGDYFRNTVEDTSWSIMNVTPDMITYEVMITEATPMASAKKSSAEPQREIGVEEFKKRVEQGELMKVEAYDLRAKMIFQIEKEKVLATKELPNDWYVMLCSKKAANGKYFFQVGAQGPHGDEDWLWTSKHQEIPEELYDTERTEAFKQFDRAVAVFRDKTPKTDEELLRQVFSVGDKVSTVYGIEGVVTKIHDPGKGLAAAYSVKVEDGKTIQLFAEELQKVSAKKTAQYDVGDKIEFVKEVEDHPVGSKGEITRLPTQEEMDDLGIEYVVLAEDGYTAGVVASDIKKVASKEKRAGAWSLPFTVEKATKLKQMIAELPSRKTWDRGETSIPEDIIDEFHEVYGDDALWDDLGKVKSGKEAAQVVKENLGSLLAYYKESPTAFKDKPSKECLEILGGLAEQVKTEEGEADSREAHRKQQACTVKDSPDTVSTRRGDKVSRMVVEEIPLSQDRSKRVSKVSARHKVLSARIARVIRERPKGKWARFLTFVKKGEIEFEFTDRYQELGIPYPDTDTMCLGQCEGTGCVPIHRNDMEEPFHTLWVEAEQENPTDDDYHFVTCPDCHGTGKRDVKEFSTVQVISLKESVREQGTRGPLSEVRFDSLKEELLQAVNREGGIDAFVSAYGEPLLEGIDNWANYRGYELEHNELSVLENLLLEKGRPETGSREGVTKTAPEKAELNRLVSQLKKGQLSDSFVRDLLSATCGKVDPSVAELRVCAREALVDYDRLKQKGSVPSAFSTLASLVRKKSARGFRRRVGSFSMWLLGGALLGWLVDKLNSPKEQRDFEGFIEDCMQGRRADFEKCVDKFIKQRGKQAVVEVCSLQK